MGTFSTDLRALINRYSRESDSNTPDFILAQYLLGCLAAFNTAVQQRETWYGRDARPSLPSHSCGINEACSECPPPEPLPCEHNAGTHPNARNYLEGAAERDGRVCSLGWPA